ncbi:hypothetical protein V1508DRAFT_399824 [Lipomyces doorenjongii]|uniref:uncharacterized protein n=1 Tax=Lipomyces doorenjongii TaxID=383834 RepID=UPI0034CD5BC1
MSAPAEGRVQPDLDIETADTQDSLDPKWRRSCKVVWIIVSVVVAIAFAIALGVGLGVGVKKCTQTRFSNITVSYGISDANIVKSPRFEKLSDWTIANGKFSFEKMSWDDGSPAGIFLPGTTLEETYQSIMYAHVTMKPLPFYNSSAPAFTVAQSSAPLPSVNQSVAGLKPYMNYSLAYAFTAVTRIATPGDWHWSTFNFSIMAAGDGGQSSAIINSYTSADIELDIHTVGSYRTFASISGYHSSAGKDVANIDRQVVAANHKGEIEIEFFAAGTGVDFYLYYVDIYDPANSTYRVVENRQLERMLSNYSFSVTENEGPFFCTVPESNIVKDPRFTSVGSDKDIWTFPRPDLAYNFERVEYFDGLPAGIYLPHSVHSIIAQDIVLPNLGAHYYIGSSFLYKTESNEIPEDSDIFLYRLRISNKSDHTITFEDFSSGLRYNRNFDFGVLQISWVLGSVAWYHQTEIHLELEVISIYSALIIPQITMATELGWCAFG